MRGFGALEIGLIVGAIVLIFGVGKLSQIGGALGRSIHDFRKERDRKDDVPAAMTGEAKAGKSAARVEPKAHGAHVCAGCGGRMSEKASFCTECGAGR